VDLATESFFRRHGSVSARVPLSSLGPINSTDVDAVLAVNRAFYDAFEGRDLDAMSEIWEHSERVICTHPGWATLRGWAAVAGSWYALFTESEQLQFILTEAHAEVAGDVAWVNVDENILGQRIGGTVAALNLFVRSDEGNWVVVGHHASPVAGPGSPEEA